MAQDKLVKVALGEGQWFTPETAKSYRFKAKGTVTDTETLYLTPKGTFILQSFNSCKVVTPWEASCFVNRNSIPMDSDLELALFPEDNEV